jgi:hypothetical protein
MRPTTLLLLTFIAFTIAACGGDAERAPAVEAQEGNEVTVAGVDYRVVLFRELNPQLVADRSLVKSIEPGPGHGLYAVLLEACNHGEESRRATDAIRLEDAFGTAYQPLDKGLDSSLTYTAASLAPGECLPADDSVAKRTFGGTAVVFELPYDITQNRPLVLRIAGPDGEDKARVVLDL